MRARRNCRLRIVCDVRPRLSAIPAEQIEFVPWSERAEVTAIQDAAAGIMPLEDSAWARGKCGYKLLTYMACGVPVVASPVGANAGILARGDAGFAARTSGEWEEALRTLLDNPGHARAMGARGRDIVEQHYSLAALAPRLAAILHTTARGSR